MSNAAFDILSKKIALKNARETVKTYSEALNRSDLTEADIVWLKGAVLEGQKLVAHAERSVKEWWA